MTQETISLVTSSTILPDKDQEPTEVIEMQSTELPGSAGTAMSPVNDSSLTEFTTELAPMSTGQLSTGTPSGTSSSTISQESTSGSEYETSTSTDIAETTVREESATGILTDEEKLEGSGENGMTTPITSTEHVQSSELTGGFEEVSKPLEGFNTLSTTEIVGSTVTFSPLEVSSLHVATETIIDETTTAYQVSTEGLSNTSTVDFIQGSSDSNISTEITSNATEQPVASGDGSDGNVVTEGSEKPVVTTETEISSTELVVSTEASQSTGIESTDHTTLQGEFELSGIITTGVTESVIVTTTGAEKIESANETTNNPTITETDSTMSVTEEIQTEMSTTGQSLNATNEVSTGAVPTTGETVTTSNISGSTEVNVDVVTQMSGQETIADEDSTEIGNIGSTLPTIELEHTSKPTGGQEISQSTSTQETTEGSGLLVTTEEEKTDISGDVMTTSAPSSSVTMESSTSLFDTSSLGTEAPATNQAIDVQVTESSSSETVSALPATVSGISEESKTEDEVTSITEKEESTIQIDIQFTTESSELSVTSTSTSTSTSGEVIGESTSKSPVTEVSEASTVTSEDKEENVSQGLPQATGLPVGTETAVTEVGITSTIETTSQESFTLKEEATETTELMTQSITEPVTEQQTSKKPPRDFCIFKGMIIQNLADVPSKDDCELCQCVDGEIVCAKRVCDEPSNANCLALPLESNQCCPKYNCSSFSTESSSENELYQTTVASSEVQEDDIDDETETEGADVSTQTSLPDTTASNVITEELSSIITSPKPVTTTQLTSLLTTMISQDGAITTVTPAGIQQHANGTFGTASGDILSEEDYEEIDLESLGPGACLFEGKIYVSAQQIPRDNPCDFCFCFRGDIICLQQSCPPPIPGCKEEIIPGFCCPRYECPVKMSFHNITRHIQHQPEDPPSLASWFGWGKKQAEQLEDEVYQTEVKGCEVQGEFYEAGALVDVSSGPCLQCR
jgi:hypothetical protein